MTNWYEKYDFVGDPYERLDPYRINLNQLKWDRNDLTNERARLDQFISDAKEGKRTSLKIFGPFRSGKTWLTRVIEGEIFQKFDNKEEDVAFIYTKIPKTDPRFNIVFRLAIEYFLEHNLKNLTKHMEHPNNLSEWEKIFSNIDFARCCRTYYNTQEILPKRWLIGDKLSSSELGKLSVNSSLSTDYDRYEMLQSLCRELSQVFSTTVLVVDELENAEVKFASQLADTLRDLFDQASEKFVLVCSFTAQREDQWYDVGYSEALSARFDHTIQLKSLEKESLVDFMKIHHHLYRKDDFSEDQLLPFEESGIFEVFDQTPAAKRVPGYFFPNCRDMVRLADSNNIKKIDAQFVQDNFEKFTHHK